MKIKELLENYIENNIPVLISDDYDSGTHQYPNASIAIMDYGYYTVKSWTIGNLQKGNNNKVVLMLNIRK